MSSVCDVEYASHDSLQPLLLLKQLQKQQQLLLLLLQVILPLLKVKEVKIVNLYSESTPLMCFRH